VESELTLQCERSQTLRHSEHTFEEHGFTRRGGTRHTRLEFPELDAHDCRIVAMKL
jgi:hypothetical protein